MLGSWFRAMAGGLATFNVQDGFCEALVRGYRSGFLKDGDYAAICGSETLEGAHLCCRTARELRRALPTRHS